MSDLEQQTRNAFELIDRLYTETSYLIREVEGQLGSEPEQFQILRPAGYGVSSATSTGLEPAYVSQWLRKVVAVGFTTPDRTDLRKGQTHTPCSETMQVLFMTVVLDDRSLEHPTIFFGCIDAASLKYREYKKFEHIMWEFPQNWRRLFANSSTIEHEDGYCSMRGRFQVTRLFSLTSGELVSAQLVRPMLALVRPGGRVPAAPPPANP